MHTNEKQTKKKQNKEEKQIESKISKLKQIYKSSKKNSKQEWVFFSLLLLKSYSNMCVCVLCTYYAVLLVNKI